eukprot:PhF_6_TR13360/c0_g1_i1/m.21162/K01560/E3.8.1.2; 2-haloacid dehalogenase
MSLSIKSLFCVSFVFVMCQAHSASNNNNNNLINCSTFNPKQIKLVTFDVFAALMDLYTSLNRDIPQVAPFLTPHQSTKFVNHMVEIYASYADHAFTKTETHGLNPFDYVGNLSLTQIAKSLNLTTRIYPGAPVWNALLATWGNLIPWNGTFDVLRRLHKAGYLIAPLSNGGAQTLRNATSIFAPEVPMFNIFSSDWPVGAFKPQPAMYAQVFSRTNFSIHQVLHVAGADIDGSGARAFGMYSALLHNPTAPDPQPCFMLANITGLID